MKDFIFDLQRFATHEVGTLTDLLKLTENYREDYVKLNDGDTIKLTADIVLNGYIGIGYGTDNSSHITLDLNGYDLTCSTQAGLEIGGGN